MGRPRRTYRPELFFEVTSMTAGGHYFLRPCAESIDAYYGVVGRALNVHFKTVKVHALNPLSTHSTEVLSACDPEEIPLFVGFVKCNLAKELRRIHGIDPRQAIFENRRARIIPIAPDQESVESRVRYCFSQGTKENLVASPRDWRGVSGVVALEKNQPVWGHWYDRTAEARARARGQVVQPREFATAYPVHFSPLPHWEPLGEKAWRQRVTDMIDEIAEKAAEKRTGTVLGFDAVMEVSPMFVGEPPKKSPAPRLHAVGKRAFDTLKKMIVSFTNACRAELERGREEPGYAPQYPPYAFPPAGPMVRPASEDEVTVDAWSFEELGAFA